MQKKKISVEIWRRKVVRRGKKKRLWIKVNSVIPGKSNQLFEVMTHGEGAFGCEWVRLESILWIHDHDLCLAKEIIKIVHASGHCDAVSETQSVLVVTSGRATGFCRFLFFKPQSKQRYSEARCGCRLWIFLLWKLILIWIRAEWNPLRTQPVSNPIHWLWATNKTVGVATRLWSYVLSPPSLPQPPPYVL